MGVYIVVVEFGESTNRFWEQFYGPNKGYIEQQYELYKQNPEAIEASIRAIFDTYGAPEWLSNENIAVQSPSQSTNGLSVRDVKKAFLSIETC